MREVFMETRETAVLFVSPWTCSSSGAAVWGEWGSELASAFITWGPLIRALLQSQISAIVTVCWWVWRDWNWLPWRPVTTSTNLNTYFCFLLGRSLSGAPPVVGRRWRAEPSTWGPFQPYGRIRGVRYILPTAANMSARSWDDPLNTSREISRNVSVE